MSNLDNWELVGKSDLGSSQIMREETTRNLFIVPATLTRRTSRRVPSREYLGVTIEWQTSEEFFHVGVDEGMTFNSGDRLNVLLSTLTSTSAGCINGFAEVEALERAPGDWVQNTLS